MIMIGIGKSLEAPSESLLKPLIAGLSGGLSFKIGYLEGRAFHKHKIVILGRWQGGSYLGLDPLPMEFVDKAQGYFAKLAETNVSAHTVLWESKKYFNDGLLGAMAFNTSFQSHALFVKPIGYGKSLAKLQDFYAIKVVEPSELLSEIELISKQRK